MHSKFKLSIPLLVSALTLSVSAEETALDKELTEGSEKDARMIDGWNMNFFKQKCPAHTARENTESLSVTGMDVIANDISSPIPGLVNFIGDVRLDQNNLKMAAGEAKMDEESGIFTAKDDIRLVTEQMRLTSDLIKLDVEKQGMVVEDARFQLRQSALRGEAESLEVSTDEPIVIKGAMLTTCPPGDTGWSFEADEIIIDTEEGWGDAYHMMLSIYDVPIFYLPKLSFPVDDRRKSGFLYPAIGSSGRNGVEIEVPWYWNIAPNRDATFDLKYLSERGVMLGTEYRHMTNHSNNILYFEFLENDKKALNEDEVDRYFYQLKTDYQNGDHWRGEIDVNSISDDNYFYDFGGNFENGNRNYLDRIANMTYADENWSVSTTVSDAQLLSTNSSSYRRMPQINYQHWQPFIDANNPQPWVFNMAAEVAAFRHDNAIESNRIVFTPELSYPVRWNWGHITPKLKWHYTHYEQWTPAQPQKQTVDREIQIFSIDSAMTFEREITLDDKAHIQTLEPRLFYLKVPYKNQDEIGLYDTALVERMEQRLFSDNRYSGSDRIGDADQLSVGITSRFIDQDNYREWLSITLGQARYFSDREMNFVFDPETRTFTDLGPDTSIDSPLVTSIDYSPSQHWRLSGDLEYNESAKRTESGILGIQYLSPELVLNLRHRTSRYSRAENIEQSELSFARQVADNFAIIGRWKQDLQKDRTIDSFIGLEYEDCCWAVRLVYRRYLNIRLDSSGFAVPGTGEYNNGVFIEFVLKGLTNLGRRLDVERDIYGYQDRFDPQED